MGTVIVGAIVFLGIALAAYSVYIDKKSGKGCQGCSGCGRCGAGRTERT